MKAYICDEGNKMSRIAYGTLVVCIILSSVSSAIAAPEPAIVPGIGHWTMDTEYSPLQKIEIPTRGQNQPDFFWYIILTITDNTGEDLDFYPKCDLMTDNFQILSEGTSVTPYVFRMIKNRHQNKYPFLESLDSAGNRILQGSDNTKDIAIIWPDFNKNVQSVKLFVSGLSNETVVIKHPVELDENGNPVKVFLRKTLELSYSIKGGALSRENATPVFKGKRWVMR